jgi:hypothetical protein
VVGEAFPALVDQVEGGPPSLPRGQRLVRFVSTHAAQLESPGGKRAVVESTQPMAVEAARGRRVPVDLGLTRVGGAYESVRPLVGVVIPARAGEGVQLPETGVSLTPVDTHGASVAGAEGAIDGASVVYANTQADSDTVVKPTLSGVETSTMLRAADSPSTVYFRVGLPAGARLVQSPAGAGPVRVVRGTGTIALVPSPTATDAAGTSVPVSMRVSGNLLAISVSTGGSHAWPVAVDPSIVVDTSLGPTECHKKGEAERESSNWCFYAGGKFTSEWRVGDEVALYNTGTVGASEYAMESYQTQGVSKIYKVEVISSGEVAGGEARLELESSTRIAKNEWWKGY